MTSRILSSIRKNIKVGDKVICQYYNAADKRYYGEFFNVSVMAIGVDAYIPVRDFVGVLDDGRIVTLWRKEIKGLVSQNCNEIAIILLLTPVLFSSIITV